MVDSQQWTSTSDKVWTGTTWLHRPVVVVLFVCFWACSSPSLQLKQKNVKHRNSSTWADHVWSLLKHVVSGTTPLSGIPASDGKGNNQESVWGRSRSSCVGWLNRKGVESVFIHHAAFLSSDTPQHHHQVATLVAAGVDMDKGFLETLLCFLLPTASGEKSFFC